MFSCSDGVVGVVDFYTNTQEVAVELCRENTDEGSSGNVPVTCMGLSPTTSFLAVGGADGRVAVFDSTRLWEQVQLVDISSPASSQHDGRAKVTALGWGHNSNFLSIGDSGGNIFLVTTVVRVCVAPAVASSDGRNTAMVELVLPSDTPAEQPSWRVITAIFNKKSTLDASFRGKQGGDTTEVTRSKRGGRHKESVADGESSNNNKNNRHSLEAVSCLVWSKDMAYLLVGRRGGALVVYPHSADNLKNFG